MKTKEICLICKHIKDDHSHRISDVLRVDGICWACDDGCWDKYHKFKLDNLSFIEEMAQEKGLL